MNYLFVAILLLTGTLGFGSANASQQIVSAANGSCLANPKGSLKPATRLVVTPCNGNPNQLWEFFADGRIVNVKSGLCMGVPWSKKDQRAGVYQGECEEKKHRLWQVEFVGDATIVVRSEAGGLCLDIENRAKTEKSKAVQDPCADIPSQIWMTTGAGVAKSHASVFDPTVPVREMLAVTSHNFSSPDVDQLESYFSDKRLERLYSEDLASFYDRALKTKWARQMGGVVPDYDIITNSQDGCPLENLTIETEQPFETSWDVTVHFQFQTCWGDQARSKVVFLIVEEDNQPVIDDIFTYENGNSQSLKVALDQIYLQN
ncbi:MAG: RICIN domain-containing protein [Roseibium sp.]